jgi:hypothetical protein
MASKKTPVGMLVIGIVNMVFGGMNLLSVVFCGIPSIILLVIVFNSAYQSAPAHEKKMLEELWPIFDRNIPGLIPFVIASVLVSIALYAMQLITGWGCVRVRLWSRRATILWCVLIFVESAVSIAWSVLVLNPGMEKASPEFERWWNEMAMGPNAGGGGAGGPGNAGPGKAGPAKTAPPAPPMMALFSNRLISDLLTVASHLLGVFICLAMLIYLVKPSTRLAVEAYNAPEGSLPPMTGEDYFDEDYLRRRRELAEPGPPTSPQ